MNFSGVYTADCLNGEGFRVVLFVSGCSHGCAGCQNPQTHNPKFGSSFTEQVKNKLLGNLQQDHIKGLTVTGGDPLFHRNFEDVLTLLREVKVVCPEKDVWLYTGYTFEQIKADLILSQILKYIDVLVDGKFEQDAVDVDLLFRGSANQRIINIPLTLTSNKICEYLE